MEWLRRYRFLILVYTAAALAGLWEFLHPGPVGEPAELMLELYPDSAEVQYKLGRIFESQHDLIRARFHFENALKTKVKTDENLVWHYAVTLVRLNADPRLIDEAIANWRYNFPESEKPDPRDPKALEAVLAESAPVPATSQAGSR